MAKYPFEKIEKKWQKYWDEHQSFKVSEDESVPKEKRAYVLDMFPYPSGAGLHVGHPEGYTATDIYCRFLRMNGYAVLHPMGFDSFGLPAENYAIKTGTHPEITTQKNIETFTRQIKSLGFSYDWSREVRTSDASYYHWTQWIFLQLYKEGLAYEAHVPINWCPTCLTGLANEEVKDGKCDRCGSQVTHRRIRQWMFKITAYAEQLLADLDKLDWPESIKAMQRNWIGKSEGAEVQFTVADTNGNEGGESITVYTTRPDTLFGASYLVLAPEHELVASITSAEQKKAVEAYIEKAAKKSDLERTDLAKEKTGVFTGGYAKNPVNGEVLPIWISDYVLVSYGTGAIMAVPAHDERDWEFATVFDLPIKQVVASKEEYKTKGAEGDYSARPTECTPANGFSVNSGAFNGLKTKEAIRRVTDFLEEKGVGKKAVNYKLRDWVFSRQRYWGEPIPLIHCEKCGTVLVPESELPLTLPETEKYTPTDSGESPLANIPEWLNTPCPQCGAPAKRETNTMPQWAGSCWYYLRYIDPENPGAFVSPEKERYWMPVDLYVGGAEHAVLHLLYARFWHKVLFDLGLVSTEEPFKRLVNQGMITAFSYQRKNKTLVPTDEVTQNEDGSYTETATGEALTQVVAKMSKSLKNVENPDTCIQEYGADSVRMYEMFMGPLEMSKPWNTNGLIGVYRFLEKVWGLHTKPIVEDTEENSKPTELQKMIHKTIRKVEEDTRTLNFNTAISQMMICVNFMQKEKSLPRSVWESFIKILNPYAPHLAEELWEKAGYSESLVYETYPTFKEDYCVDSDCTVVIQINGKLRSKLQLPIDTPKEEVEAKALADETAQKFIDGRTIRKIIIVPNKIVNIVI